MNGTNGNGHTPQSFAAVVPVVPVKPKRARKARLKRFIVLEQVATIEGETEEAARKRLPVGRIFVLREEAP